MGGGSSGARVVHSSYAGTGSYNATLDTYAQEQEHKPKVFISFSYKNIAQVELLREQASNEKYDLDFNDSSLQYSVKNRDWHGPVGTKIVNSDAMIVMIGEDTASRSAVSWEIKQAYQNDIPIIPVYVHKDRTVEVPKEIKYNSDKPINWKLDNIQYELDKATGG